MNPILANYSASITELKRNPNLILQEAGEEAVAVLNHNIPVAYLVPTKTFEALLDALDDQYLAGVITSRQKDFSKAIEVNLDDL